jgi:hypothetical protein
MSAANSSIAAHDGSFVNQRFIPFGVSLYHFVDRGKYLSSSRANIIFSCDSFLGGMRAITKAYARSKLQQRD